MKTITFRHKESLPLNGELFIDQNPDIDRKTSDEVITDPDSDITIVDVQEIHPFQLEERKGQDGPNSQYILVNADADNAAAKDSKKSFKDVKTKPPP